MNISVDKTLQHTLERPPELLYSSKCIVGRDAGGKLLEGTAKMMVSELAFMPDTHTLNPCQSSGLSTRILTEITLKSKYYLSMVFGSDYLAEITL